MARRDYYAVLGVKKNASTEDIKKSFRTLALRYHPDRNPGDADAERRFREVAEAWNVLGDAESRERYDRMGPLFTPSGRPPRPDELNEILMDAINGILRRKKPGGPGEELKYTVTVSLEDAAAGTDRPLTVQRMARCRPCDGTGDGPTDRKPCVDCGGTGKAAARRLFRNDCAACDGKGYKPSAKCERCNGEGRHPLEETLKIKVPAGVATGTKLKLKGKGNDALAIGGVAPGPAGDLLIVMNVEEHALFRRRGNDLLVEAPVTFAEAALGCDLTVPTLEGRTTIRIPPGTASGKSFRLPARGLPGVGGGARGDLHVKLVVEVPITLDADARKALEAFVSRVATTSHPRRQAFLAAMRERNA